MSDPEKEDPKDKEPIVLSVDARGRLHIDPSELDPTGPLSRQYAAARKLKQVLEEKKQKKKKRSREGSDSEE